VTRLTTAGRDGAGVRDGPPPDGYLLLHVWLEQGHPSPLRVRVTGVPALDEAVASVDEAVECVREWLASFVASNLADIPVDEPEEYR
jgi:hypothetical protein